MVDEIAPRKGGLLWLSVAAAVGFAILVGLGVWQLQRLQWKNGLIQRIEARAKGGPRPLGEVLKQWRETHDVAFERVHFKGRFLHQHEMHLYAIHKGAPGWRIITPVETGNQIVLVDRGFVPVPLKAREKRRNGQIAGAVEIIGLAREAGRKGWFTPKNQPAKNLWYWRDLESMAARSGAGKSRAFAPFYVDMQSPKAPGGWPLAGVTRLNLPNKHLEYALTWFALAATLLGVYGALLWSRRKSSP